MKPLKHLLGKNCLPCSKRSGAANRNLGTSRFIEKATAVHGDKYDYSLVEYVDSNTYVKIICKKHGLFNQEPNNHLAGRGCQVCRESKLENTIVQSIELLNISYHRQHTFRQCRNEAALKFDFYLPDHQILIEAQGEQHYQPVEAWGGEEAFVLNQKRDQIKRDFVLNLPGYILLEIRYDETDIDQVIDDAIESQSKRKTNPTIPLFAI